MGQMHRVEEKLIAVVDAHLHDVKLEQKVLGLPPVTYTHMRSCVHAHDDRIPSQDVPWRRPRRQAG